MRPCFRTTRTYNQSQLLYPYEEPYKTKSIAIIMHDQNMVYKLLNRKTLISKIISDIYICGSQSTVPEGAASGN